MFDGLPTRLALDEEEDRYIANTEARREDFTEAMDYLRDAIIVHLHELHVYLGSTADFPGGCDREALLGQVGLTHRWVRQLCALVGAWQTLRDVWQEDMTFADAVKAYEAKATAAAD